MSENSSRSLAIPDRRHILRVMGAFAGLPLLIAGVRATAPKGQLHSWHGEVLGALSELTLWHTDAAFARTTILKMRREIERLERIFSLYVPDSEISRLNEAGRLMKPSPELRQLIEKSQYLGELSGGAFDISVQPLWRLYEGHFWSHKHLQSDILAKAHDVARSFVDFRGIESGTGKVGFARAGMAITLNGNAQGAITDAITDMLRNEGFESAMVDLGEFRAIGHHPDGRPWRLGIPNGKSHTNVDRVFQLDDNMALAVSGGYGTTFESSGRFHHIFDPHTGGSANNLVQAAVFSPSATDADGLATAICVTGEASARRLLAAYPQTWAILTRLDGTSITISPNGLATG
jgi:FAD:protein FMN transferase